MIIIRDIPQAALVTDIAIRQMVLSRIEAIASGEPYDANLHGYFIVIEAGDTLQDIAATIGFDPTERPCEILEAYATCYDLLFIIDDSGYGIELFIPKTEGIPPELGVYCQQYAVPGTL